MSEHIRNFIDSIADGDNVAARNEFDLEMATRLNDTLERKREEVAKMFVKPQGTEEDSNV